MRGLKDTFANLASLRGRFERLLSSASRQRAAPAAGAARLGEVVGFGSNPGNLRMFRYGPRGLPKAPALVVALHGCTQTAANYDQGSGWSELADSHGFMVLFPEQQRANNPNNCFNWFLPSDARRDHGEAHSIRQMIERMAVDHGIDRRRVFVVGLSAGGAMASALLAAYPEVFAGGAVIAGLPYASALNVQQAFEVMAKGRERPAREWGDLVRSASHHSGSWPKISIWHGTSDTIVSPTNMEDAVKQWVDVHGVSARPLIEHEIEGHSRRVWRSPDDVDVIEAIAINGMGHGVPLATGRGLERCGNAGAFHLDVGISSSHHIARFWGLAARRVVSDKHTVAHLSAHPPVIPAALVPETPLLAARAGAIEERLGDAAGKDGAHEGAFPDPRAIITAALKAAGVLEPGPGPGGSAFDPRRLITSTLRSVRLLKE